MIRDELELCGYFAIITSEKMNAKQAISKNRQQYDQLTKELKELLDKKKALQSEEVMKAIAERSRSYEDILRYIKSDPLKDKE